MDRISEKTCLDSFYHGERHIQPCSLTGLFKFDHSEVQRNSQGA